MMKEHPSCPSDLKEEFNIITMMMMMMSVMKLHCLLLHSASFSQNEYAFDSDCNLTSNILKFTEICLHIILKRVEGKALRNIFSIL